MSIFDRIFKRGDRAEEETALCEPQTVATDQSKQTTLKEDKPRNQREEYVRDIFIICA